MGLPEWGGWDLVILERATGIEPVSLAWKAKVLPLHNARVRPKGIVDLRAGVKRLAGGKCVGFERNGGWA